jgi:hypothetical protein
MPRLVLSRVALAACLAVSLAGCVNILPKPNVPLALIELPADRAKAPAAPLRVRVGNALIALGSTLVTPIETRQPSLTD